MPHGTMSTDRLIGIDYDRMRKYRLDRIKKEMEKNDVGTLVTWDEYTIRYICGGYVTIPLRWAKSQMVVLPRNGDPYLFMCTSFSPFAMREEMPWVKDQIWPTIIGLKWVDRDSDVDKFMKEIMPIIADHGLTGEAVALDGCCKELLFTEGFKRNGIPRVIDGQSMCVQARLIKNEDEIACMRMAARMAESAFDAMSRAIRPGVRECELVGIGMERLFALGADECQEFVCASGPRTNPMHIDFTDRIIGPGELVAIDINGNSYNGYKSCYYRTFCCGKATQEQKDTFKECRDMLYEGMKGIKAGNTTADICAGWPKSPKYWGYDTWGEVSGYALGHGLGICLHDGPRMFSPGYLEYYCDTLEEGMTIAIETWAGKRGGNFGVRLEEEVVVTKDGYELLTHWPIDELMECNY